LHWRIPPLAASADRPAPATRVGCLPAANFAAETKLLQFLEKWARAVTFSVYGMSHINASCGDFKY
jgi:hypothetical protein